MRKLIQNETILEWEDQWAFQRCPGLSEWRDHWVRHAGRTYPSPDCPFCDLYGAELVPPIAIIDSLYRLAIIPTYGDGP